MNSKDKLTSESRKVLNKLELPDRGNNSVKKDTNKLRSRDDGDDEWLSKAQLEISLNFYNSSKLCQPL